MEPLKSRIAFLMLFEFCLSSAHVVWAQADGSSITCGNYRTVHSNVLGEDRTLLIRLPADYGKSDKKYPVLYKLDGEQGNFLHALSAANYLFDWKEGAPDPILVGIANTDRGRDMAPDRGAGNFIRFLQDELIPFIDKSYRTNGFRIVCGQSFSSMFAAYSFLKQPALFDAYVLSSFGLYNESLGARFEAELKKQDLAKVGKKYLFVANGKRDTYDPDGTTTARGTRFLESLRKAAPASVSIQTKDYDDEGHVPFPSIYDALRWIYSVEKAAAATVSSPQRASVSFAETGQQLNRLAGRGVALGDFNGDGCLDAFVVNQNTPDGSGQRVYFGDCHGRFTDSGQVLADASGFGVKPAIGDVNGDGKLDVITGRTVWLNDGKGHFTPHPESIPGSEKLDVVHLADLDRDGNLDLVAIAGWRSVSVYLGDGKGHFRDTGQRFGSGIMAPIALGDVDGDGTIDLVTGGWRNSGGDPCPNRVWLNDGKGNFRDSGQVFDEGDTHVHGMALGDVDGDGRPDIVLAMTTPGRAGKIYLNDGKGRFHDSGQIIGHQWAHSVALGDLNGDGHLDIFLACGEPHTGTPNEVWLNDGKGNFRDSGLRLGNAFSWDVALGDLNGDGRLDAFVANLRLADDSKSPPVFGGVPAEVWLSTTASTDYLGQTPPGETPVVFAQGVVSDGHIHSRLAISPDGDQMCWTSVPTLTGQGVPRIVCVAHENGTWTKPRTPPFAAEGMTANPLFSPDGARLFFDYADSREKGWGARYVEKTGAGWSTPRSDGVPLKTSSSFTKSGKVYYSDGLSGKPWGTGIYSARYSAAGYSDAKALDAAINSPYIDYTPYISPDESYLMFSSSRPSADERMLLHISFRNSDGTWSPPRRMNDLIGFAGAARFPSISPDGRYLFFCGDDGNFYWADIKAIEKLKQPAGRSSRPADHT